jgi:hypothetical protein
LVAWCRQRTPGGITSHGIHEVYYDKHGEPFMMTDRAVEIDGETLAELRGTS